MNGYNMGNYNFPALDQMGGYTELPPLNPMLGAPLPQPAPAPPLGTMDRFRNWMTRATPGTYEADIPQEDRLESLKRAVLLGAMKSSQEVSRGGQHKGRGLPGMIGSIAGAGVYGNEYYNNLLQNDINQRVGKVQEGLRERVTTSGERHAGASEMSAQASMINAMRERGEGAPTTKTFWSTDATGKRRYMEHQWMKGYDGRSGGIPNWIPLGEAPLPGSGTGITPTDRKMSYYSNSVKTAKRRIFDFQNQSLKAGESIFNLPATDARKVVADKLLQDYVNAKKVFRTAMPLEYATTEWGEEDAQAEVEINNRQTTLPRDMPPGATFIGTGRLKK